MLKIIEGSLFSVAEEEMRDEIKRLTLEGRKLFLIVPEQQAVTAEKEFAEFLPESAPLTFEVTNFTRLANTVYRTHGGIAAEYGGKGKEALVMWKTLRELSPYLKLTEGMHEISQGTVSKALSAYAEMKSLALTPDAIAEIAANPEIRAEKKLSEKLLDISKIMVLFTKLYNEKYASSQDDCERLVGILENNKGLLSEADFYVSGFTSFTKPQINLLSLLMERTSLTVHLTVSRPTYDCFEFSEIMDTRAELLLAADKKGCSKKIIRSESIAPSASPIIYELFSLIWRTFSKLGESSSEDINDAIGIYEASDPYEASMFVAADIKHAVMEGAKYSDFAIISRDGEKYSGIIDSYLAEANIPCFVSKKSDISQYEAIKLIYTAFAAVRSEFSRKDILTYAKCRLSGIDAEACDEFELYCEKWQINGRGFYEGGFWNMHPDGYDGRDNDESREILLRIDKSRHTIIDPLISFSLSLKKAKTVCEHARALVDFLTEISLEEKINRKCDMLTSLGEDDAASENSMLWRIICRALDDMAEVLGDSEIDSFDFENQLKVILSEADIGKIPTFSDVITLASADMARLPKKKYVYLFGVNASEFPANGKSSSYFSDRDKLTLSSLGIIKDDIQTASARELFFFSRAGAVAQKRVSFVFFNRNEAYERCERAAVIDRIIEMTDGKADIIKISSLPVIDRIYSPYTAMAHSENCEIRRALIDTGYEREIKISEKNIENLDANLTDGVKTMLYGDDISLTQTRIDTYIDCPFAYFLRYNIKISENERAEFDARTIGTFVHAILENFFSGLKDEGMFAYELSPDDKALRVKTAAEKYLSEKSHGIDHSAKRTGITIDRICKAALPIVDGLCDELSDCKFIPEFFELSIDGRNDENPKPANFKYEDSRNVSIHGIIDRVDVYKSGDDAYVRVIDYKSGSKSFSPKDIDEGRNLQMFLYLKAITETDNEKFRDKIGVGKGGRIIPAGVIYVKTDMSDVEIAEDDEAIEHSAVMKKQERFGMLLDDSVSIDAMNKSYIPVKYNKNGEPSVYTKNNLYTLEGWDEINKKISDRMLDVSSRMKNGEISASKQGDTKICERCKFKSICRKKKRY